MGDNGTTVEEVLEVIESIPAAVAELEAEQEWWEEEERRREEAAVQWALDEAQLRRERALHPREE